MADRLLLSAASLCAASTVFSTVIAVREPTCPVSRSGCTSLAGCQHAVVHPSGGRP
jgi:hypothetical protein